MPTPTATWCVIPTGNLSGDLAICHAGQTKPTNRIATVPVRPGCPGTSNAAIIALAPRMREILRTIDRDGLIDHREHDGPMIAYTIKTLLSDLAP